MASAELIATLRNMKVPRGLPASRKLVDHLIEQAESESTQSPQQKAEALEKMRNLSLASDLDVITAIANIEKATQLITKVVDKHTETLKLIAKTVDRLVPQVAELEGRTDSVVQSISESTKLADVIREIFPDGP
jgi:uncharacterized protein Yka (UPF0111/DUF47 family)